MRWRATRLSRSTSVRGLSLGALVIVGLGPACASDPAPYAWAPRDSFHPLHPQAYANPPAHARTRSSPPVLPRRDHPEWYPSSRRISSRWTTIVIHHSATDGGGARRFDRYHRKSNGWDELGYHFVIGNGTDTPDGYVEVGSRWRKQKHGAHCKTRGNYHNEHGIGICLVGDFTKTKPTRKQLASLNELVSFLCGTSDIPSRRVTTHRAATKKTQCPGQNFDLAALRRSLRRSFGI